MRRGLSQGREGHIRILEARKDGESYGGGEPVPVRVDRTARLFSVREEGCTRLGLPCI